MIMKVYGSDIWRIHVASLPVYCYWRFLPIFSQFYRSAHFVCASQQSNKFGQLIDASFRPIFSTRLEERCTDPQKYLPIEMQFCISVMFLGLPEDKHEEKPSFLQFEKKRITERQTDRPTDGRTNGRTDPLIEVRGRI